MKAIILLPILAICSFSVDAPGVKAGDHDFHVSKCLVEYNEGEQALQMSLHLFIDDLEEALRRQGADKLFICTQKEDEQAERYIYRYLQQHFRFEVNGKEQNYAFIGKEVSEDLAAVWCYLEITGVSTLRILKVDNSILMDAFEDQKNLVSITGPGRKKGLLLFQKGDTVKQAEF
ncbi:MAG: hypothetical protein H6557_23245 [Lewinellaceae bacterium]|nr:hypothetical protein [Phaeodactylibacter sp.]MCB9039544.1 hypothetical protein [Lewinellaceae bacterium]